MNEARVCFRKGGRQDVEKFNQVTATKLTVTMHEKHALELNELFRYNN